MTTKRALVLAGGGVAGIAWETGVLRGIADESPATAKALLGSDVLVGTSAGSTVGRSTPSPFGSVAVEEVDSFGGSAFGVFADEESLAAFGANPLDPVCRAPSALAGREQGRRVAGDVADFLGG